MAAISTAQATEMKRRSNLFKELARKYGDGFFLFMKNFDVDTGLLDVTVADTVAATEAHLFTVGPAAGTTPRISIADNTGKTGDFILTIKPGTLAASRTVLFPDSIGANDVIVTTDMAQTITGVKTMTTPILSAPVIADFSSATHTHASAAQGGSINLPSLEGTSKSTFTINYGAAVETEIAITSAGTTGGFTATLAVPTLAADRTITFPAVTCTLASITGTETLTNKTLTSPVIGTGLTASGSAANTFGGSTGTFVTSTGANTLSGDVTVANGKTFAMTGTGTFGTGTGAVSLNGDVTIAAGKSLTLATGAGIATFNGATSGAIVLSPISVGTGSTTIVNQASAAATITLPASTSSLATLGLNETHSGNRVFTGTVDLRGAVTASASNPNIDFHSSSGTFLTCTGENTLSGNVTISGSKTLTTGTGAAVLKGSATFDTTKTLTFGSASAGTGTPIVMYSLTAANGSLSLKVVDQASNYASTIQTNSAIGAAATYTLPPATGTLAILGANVWTGAQTGSGTASWDLSGANGIFKTPNGGAITIGAGAVGITGVCTFTTMPIIPTTTKAANLAIQATATALVTGFNLVTCADGSNTAVVLPAPTAGSVVIVKNGSAQTAKVFPSSGKAINALGADAAYNMATVTAATFVAYDGNTWYTVPLAAS